jgi:hypothetical protein
MRYGPGGEFNTALSEGSQNCFLQGHGANVALIIVGRGPPPFRKIAKLLHELGRADWPGAAARRWSRVSSGGSNASARAVYSISPEIAPQIPDPRQKEIVRISVQGKVREG